ncbi:hypothetical protein [Amycolatopsis sp. DG1A-15b]|uniref:hypothetical protein n=1 Tax=Amycolatopsis sp. DG1A-15b TaxID=3052846 RepID=UPI00255C1960|nr:hypothetical protein [Amycolatopsis sp. DG1A-15b]WIX93244.1 hypothetical protein QRY02_23475 [Amycolatopsis sp. DG1A-15b]
MAVVGYATACGWLDPARAEGLRQEVSKAGYHDLPAIVADLPAPRWDTVPATTPVGDLEREFAITLLDIAAQYESLSGADRRWRTILAAGARTAADLLVLFLDIEPHLRPRRNDPGLARSGAARVRTGSPPGQGERQADQSGVRRHPRTRGFGREP